MLRLGEQLPRKYSEGPSTSSLWIYRKSVQRFPRYLMHNQKIKTSQTVLKTEPYSRAVIIHWTRFVQPRLNYRSCCRRIQIEIRLERQPHKVYWTELNCWNARIGARAPVAHSYRRQWHSTSSKEQVPGSHSIRQQPSGWRSTALGRVPSVKVIPGWPSGRSWLRDNGRRRAVLRCAAGFWLPTFCELCDRFMA